MSTPGGISGLNSLSSSLLLRSRRNSCICTRLPSSSEYSMTAGALSRKARRRSPFSSVVVARSNHCRPSWNSATFTWYFSRTEASPASSAAADSLSLVDLFPHGDLFQFRVEHREAFSVRPDYYLVRLQVVDAKAAGAGEVEASGALAPERSFDIEF